MPTTQTKLAATLQARLDIAYGPVWAAGNPAEFVDEFLTDDAVLTASDTPRVWHGRAQSLEAIQELMKAYSTIKPKAIYTKALGPSAAFQFVVFEATGNDAEHKKTVAKSLYVWVKTQKGWRVTADHYSFSGMDPLR
jgi:ketosteroid isomerase-like protein